MPTRETKALTIDLVDGFRRIDYAGLVNLPPPVSSSFRIFPIPHEKIVDYIMDSISHEDLRLRESLYAVSFDNERFIGLIELLSRHVEDDEKSWIIAATNANDGTDGVSIYGGCRVFASNALFFHEELSVIRNHTEKAFTELEHVVSSAVKNLHEHWSVNEDRAEAYKQFSLTREASHDIICQVIRNEIVAGRDIGSLLLNWHSPFSLFPGRNLWSLFNCMTKILNGLKPVRMIDRTMKLVSYLDEISKFKNKATKHIQARLI